MKRDRRTQPKVDAAQALRALIRAEMAHERAAADEARAKELEHRVSQAREHYTRLAGAGA